ncbi:hypothetical protein D3C78_1127500 [compost metagenome]
MRQPTANEGVPTRNKSFIIENISSLYVKITINSIVYAAHLNNRTYFYYLDIAGMRSIILIKAMMGISNLDK